MKKDFMEKGYKETDLENTISDILLKDRDDLLRYKLKPQTEEGEVRFICDFNDKARNIKKNLNKHWHVLLNDGDLKQSIGATPKIVFRGTKNVKSSLVRSKTRKNDIFKNSFGLKEGFYQCGSCFACRSTDNKKKFIGSYFKQKQSKTVKIGGILNCCSKNVVYMLECPCGLRYIGRTKRAFNVSWSSGLSQYFMF